MTTLAIIWTVIKLVTPSLCTLVIGLFAQSPIQKVIAIQVEVHDAQKKATETGDSTPLDRVL